MFESLFQYPARVFSQGDFVFLSRAPVWALVAAIFLAAGGLSLLLLRRKGISRLTLKQRLIILSLQSSMVAVLLIMLWQPAIRVSALKSQQNVVAVVIDDSKSMSVSDNGQTRIDHAKKILNDELITGLEKQFQVRLYRAGSSLTRISGTDELRGEESTTRLSDNLKQAVAEATTLPVGAIVLLSDGADNSGGLDLASLSEIRRQRIPIHTIGFGREKFAKDLEITSADIASRTLNGARLSAQVTFRQNGYEKKQTRLLAKADGNVLASKDLVLKKDGETQTESILLPAGAPGPRTVEFSIEAFNDEENKDNNSLRRLVTVESATPRVLYIEGEPRWEYKFIRRAMDDDPSLRMASILRTTQNKIYRQGIDSPTELEDGFPATPEELFKFQGVVIGGVEASYFTRAQQEAIRDFVDRRGGGVLFLGGRSGLGNGGYAASEFAQILPVTLPDKLDSFQRETATTELTPAGRESVITQLDDSAAKNIDKWKALPYLANYQEVGSVKPGAVVLVEAKPSGKGKIPLLATQNFGRGRTGVFATGGTWRWKMSLEHTDKTHPLFWQQLMRWLVSGSPGQVSGSPHQYLLSDERIVQIHADVRNKTFQTVSDASVEARITGPEGVYATVQLNPEPMVEGSYAASWTAERPGSYVVEIVAKQGDEEIGSDTFNFRREDGVAENFGREQNRELLTRLSAETGGAYYTPANADRLLDEITFSEAGLTVRETRDLWNMPIIFLLLLALCATEWILRRRWGVV